MLKRISEKAYNIGMPVLAIFSIVLVILDLTENLSLDAAPYF